MTRATNETEQSTATTERRQARLGAMGPWDSEGKETIRDGKVCATVETGETAARSKPRCGEDAVTKGRPRLTLSAA